MPISHLFFGFAGRINRGKWWGAVIALVLVNIAVYTVIAALMFDAYHSPFDWLDRSGPLPERGAPLVILIVWEVAAFIASLAISVKRLHDRDRSGWWVLVFWFLPVVLSATGLSLSSPYSYSSGGSAVFSLAALALWIWAFIELGCLRGTIGPNRFGTDPLPPPFSGGRGMPDEPPYPGQALPGQNPGQSFTAPRQRPGQPYPGQAHGQQWPQSGEGRDRRPGQ